MRANKILSIGLLLAVLLLMMGTASADFVPETYNITAIDDTYIAEAFPDTNFNGVLYSDQYVTDQHYLSIRDSTGIVKVAYLKFNVTDSVSNIILNYYISGGDGSGLKLYEVSNDWDVDTITWNSGRPSTDYSTPVESWTPTLGAWNQLNLSEYVQLPGTYSFAFSTTSGGNLYFRSSEHETQAPYVSVTTAETFDTIYISGDDVENVNITMCQVKPATANETYLPWQIYGIFFAFSTLLVFYAFLHRDFENYTHVLSSFASGALNILLGYSTYIGIVFLNPTTYYYKSEIYAGFHIIWGGVMILLTVIYIIDIGKRTFIEKQVREEYELTGRR